MLRYSAGMGIETPDCQFKLCSKAEIAAAEKAGLDFIANREFARGATAAWLRCAATASWSRGRNSGYLG
jgi:hypothetical protein